MFVLPDYPATTKWLSTREKAVAVWRMERDVGSRDEDDQGLIHSLKLALCDYRVCLSSLFGWGRVQPKKNGNGCTDADDRVYSCTFLPPLSLPRLPPARWLSFSLQSLQPLALTKSSRTCSFSLKPLSLGLMFFPDSLHADSCSSHLRTLSPPFFLS